MNKKKRPDNSISGFRAVSKDISEIKFIEDLLWKKERQHLLLFETMPQGIIYQESTGKITAMNSAAERILGLTFEQWHRHTFAELSLNIIHEDGSVFAVEELPSNLSLTSGKSVRNIVMGILGTTDNECHWVTVNSIPLFQPGVENPQQVYTIFNDITEQKQTEEYIQLKNEQLTLQTLQLEQANIRLQEVDRLKSIFLASMSHELRTPLNSIIGFTGILLQGLTGEINTEQQQQLSIVKSSANHLLSLINDVLDISKLEAGRIELSLDDFNLDELLNEIMETFIPMTDLKGLELIRNSQKNIKLHSDRRRIKQVTINLLSNAIKFTDKGGVTISASVVNGNMLQIRVNDTGIGMKREAMKRLFQPFQQIDSTLTKSREGTGLGLYLSKKLAILMGGDISAKSEYGKGSEFTYTTLLECRREVLDEKDTDN